MGFAEVIRKLGFFRQLMGRVKSDIAAFSPDRICSWITRGLT